MDLVFVDSCVLIYAMEEDPQFGQAARQALSTAWANRQTVAISPLVQLECLVHPLSRQQADLVARYQDWLRQFRWLPINDITFALATELRAKHKLKTPDALHLATALQHQCVALISNDKRLERANTNLQCLSL
jgi:uncharacterized protein